MPRSLHVQLDPSIGAATLRSLHAGDVNATLADLLQRAGAERMAPVYELSEQEISSDRYGFAREFKVMLRVGTNTGSAIATLRESPYVKSVETVSAQQPRTD